MKIEMNVIISVYEFQDLQNNFELTSCVSFCRNVRQYFMRRVQVKKDTMMFFRGYLKTYEE